MKNSAYFLLVLLLSFIAKPSYSQDFWEVVPTPDTANLVSMTINSNGDIFLGSNGVYLSQDNGETWEFKGIYGKTWDTVFALFDNEGTNDFAITSDGIVYAGTTDYIEYGGGVYQSSDSGDTWKLNGLHNHYIKALAINSFGTLYAGSTGYILGIFEKSQTGHNWTLLQGNVAVAAIIITQNNEIYIGCHYDGGVPGGCLFSSDYGQSWTLLNSGLLSNDIDHLCLSPDQYLYAIGDNTLYRSINPTVSVISSKTDNTKVDLFPNPFVESLYFKINSSVKSNNCSLVVFDIKGALLKKMEFTDPGNAQILTIDGSDWIPGIYFFRVIIGDYRHSSKIIKID